MVTALRPTGLDEALKMIEDHKALPFAGGTDLMVRHRGYTGTGPKIAGPVLFLDAVEELKELRLDRERLTIGAGATLSQILGLAKLPELLRRSIELIAAPGLRNRATMAGNVCNASPAGDSIPPLYVHEASVVIASRRGERILPIEDFLLGPGKTALKEDEILTGFSIPLLPPGRCYYRKVGTRRANALSKLSAAGFAALEDGKIVDFRFALGAVAPTVIRLSDAEEQLRGTDTAAIEPDAVLAAAEPVIRPIDDQRSTAAYRKRIALNALAEFLTQLSTQQKEEA